MDLEKNNRAKLDKRKGIFFQVCLVIVLSIVLISFERTRGGLNVNEYEAGIKEQLAEIMISGTGSEQPKSSKTTETKDSEIEIKNITEEQEVTDDNKIFVIVKNMPGFQGKGQDGFRAWIAKNLRYPELAAEKGISGRVYVKFVVERDGSVSNVSLVKGIDPALDKEAVRVIKASPRWTPGMQKNKAVRVLFTFPVIFELP